MYLCRHVNVIRRRVNVCHGFVPSCIRYFCHANVFHAHACHAIVGHAIVCLLYTSPSPRDRTRSRMPSSA